MWIFCMNILCVVCERKANDCYLHACVHASRAVEHCRDENTLPTSSLFTNVSCTDNYVPHWIHLRNTYELIENIYFCWRIRILISAYGFKSTHKLPWTLNTHNWHTNKVYTQYTQTNGGSEASWLHFQSLSITLYHTFVCA